jgi:hypothetical protein
VVVILFFPLSHQLVVVVGVPSALKTALMAVRVAVRQMMAVAELEVTEPLIKDITAGQQVILILVRAVVVLAGPEEIQLLQQPVLVALALLLQLRVQASPVEAVVEVVVGVGQQLEELHLMVVEQAALRSPELRVLLTQAVVVEVVLLKMVAVHLQQAVTAVQA